MGIMSEQTEQTCKDNMAERAADLGGKLVIGPAEGGGTQLDWRVPVS